MMVWLLRKCEKCGQYTLKTDVCPYCGGKVTDSDSLGFLFREEAKDESINDSG